jgi:hypothetical protein
MAPAAALIRLNRWIVVLAVAGLLAALLAPDGRWLGVADLGAMGATLYALSVTALVWQVALWPDRLFPAEWSIAERRGWSALFFGGLILLSFAHFLWSEARSSLPPMSLQVMMFRHFGWNLGTLGVAALIVRRLCVVRSTELTELDERDLRIRHAADRVGNFLLTGIVIAIVLLLVSLPYEMASWWLAPLVAAHVLIGLLICKSVAENAWIVAAYARERE